MPTGDQWDVLKIRALKNVRIYGQGACGNVDPNKINWSMNIKYKVEGKESAKGVFIPQPDLKD